MKEKASIGATVLVALVAMMPGTSPAKMRSVELSKNVCQTTGGGRFVDIPGFPGEKIDRRLLRDIKLLRRKYKIFITDGYSTDPAHSANGEHPIGLALDIVPNFAAGGTWNDIDRLARMAEPQQNQPRSPFRWGGYDGDAGHGRGHHLHLSYSHSATPPKTPAETVYSLRCPDGGGGGEQSDGGDGSGDGGGISTGGRATSDGGSGISTQSVAPTDLAPVQTETGGVSR
ncbi:MAG: hypothetical protein M3355_03545 [Actinomycetota bacterium]|nr:hypothetical protein [Actinomycetota bacterium]